MKPSEIEIRGAGAADATAIALLSEQLGYPASVSQAETRLAALLGAKEHEVFVAVVDNRILGWIHVYLARRIESEPFGELGGLVVAAACRRRGIGRCLLARAEEWLKSCGVARLRVRVRADREEARIFYRRLDFARTKEQQVFDKTL